jgi:hypothetical protein
MSPQNRQKMRIPGRLPDQPQLHYPRLGRTLEIALDVASRKHFGEPPAERLRVLDCIGE